MSKSTVAVLFLLGLAVVHVTSHGYLIDPPERSSIWRIFPTGPINNDDNGINCGGFGSQFGSLNQGRCGECGDEWSLARPRPNEEGGKYFSGIISQYYKMGNYVRMTAVITANHLGYFEFKLCADKKSLTELANQECFDKYLLKLADGSTRYQVGSATGYHDVLIKLPDGVTCDYCVIQWTYTAGNNWGVCADGTGAMGCGNQETFVNCADVRIN